MKLKEIDEILKTNDDILKRINELTIEEIEELVEYHGKFIEMHRPKILESTFLKLKEKLK